MRHNGAENKGEKLNIVRYIKVIGFMIFKCEINIARKHFSTWSLHCLYLVPIARPRLYADRRAGARHCQ